MPLTTLLASHDASTGANGVTCHFDHLDVKNAMVPVIVLSTSHDADTNTVASHDTNTNASGIM